MTDTRSLFVLIDRKTRNLLGEFDTREEAQEMLDVLIEYDVRARDDVEIVGE